MKFSASGLKYSSWLESVGERYRASYRLEVPLILWTPLRHISRRRCLISTQRRTFTAEFKAEAGALVRRTGQSANQIAKELGVSQTALSRWLRQSAVPSHRANRFQVAEEVQVLRRAVHRLRMERDILKKAAAFFANESR